MTWFSRRLRDRRQAMGLACLALIAVIGIWQAQPWWPAVVGWLCDWWPLVVVVALALSAGQLLARAPDDDVSPLDRWRPLSNRAIAMGGVLVMAAGLASAVALLLAYGHGGADQRNQLEVIKTAGAMVLGAGGAVGLLLAARRQQAIELTLLHTEKDASERRTTELYAKAAEQLGSAEAPVRLACLYAMDRLGQTSPEQRQAIVDVLCSYLRMPFARPDQMTASSADDHRSWVQEREVRIVGQNLLVAHLQPESARFWPGLDLNLSGAVLIDFDVAGSRFRAGRFDGAIFVGNACFSSAGFAGEARFSGARFTRDALFDHATFTAAARFADARFARYLTCAEAVFGADVDFCRVEFAGHTVFDDSTFAGASVFEGTHFLGDAGFVGATFGGDVALGGAVFTRDAAFDRAVFHDGCACGGAVFAEGVPTELTVFCADIGKAGSA